MRRAAITTGNRFTTKPFTVAVCTACGAAPDSALMPRLREVVRNCPHGMLVATQCLLGGLTCATLGPRRGRMLLLQPCTVDRIPTGSVQWIGPISSDVEAEAACAWISVGLWDRARLPLALRADLNLTRPSRLN